MIAKEIIASLLFILGVFIYFTATVGVFKFKYVLNRVHAAALGDTLGILFFVSGGIVWFGFEFVSLKLLLILVFLWFTSPVASHFISALEVTTNREAAGKEYEETTVSMLREEEKRNGDV